MTCYHPLKAYRSLAADPETGKHGLVFNPVKALIEGSSIKLPCGRCHGCRMDRAQDWATRCLHEAQMHERNCFLTLSYSNEHVPQDFSVRKRPFQLFMKRLRFEGLLCRFFAVGEYGEQTLRPHYHALLFGVDFEDKTPWAKRNGFQTFKSKLLDKLWPFGHHEIGTVTAQSAGYVARYTLKKLNGPVADDHYWRRSPVDGQFYRVEPEFSLMSRRPGIGTTWFDRFSGDAFPSDFLVVEGRKVRPPQFYLDKYAARHVPASPRPGFLLRDEASAPDLQIKRKRKLASLQPEARWNSTPERLEVREVVATERMKRLVRQL